MTRTIKPALLTVLAALALALLLPAGAASATAYRYWGYFELQGQTWKFATKGPAQTKPADGSVEGWRFAVGTSGDTRTPRGTATFAQICQGTKAATGKKRVAVVIDYGRSADYADPSTKPKAPVGRCASVATDASGMEVLGAVADVRQKTGLVCGIDKLPATGCGDAVKTVPAAAKAPDQPVKLQLAAQHTAPKADSGPSTGTLAGIGVVVLALLGLGGTALVRRRNAG